MAALPLGKSRCRVPLYQLRGVSAEDLYCAELCCVTVVHPVYGQQERRGWQIQLGLAAFMVGA